MAYAVIEDGVVVNTIMWDGDTENWQPPEGQIAVEIPDGSLVAIGTKYSDGAFAPDPIEEIPPFVPSAEDILQANTVTRDGLLTTATQSMTPLLLSLQLGDATSVETASAKAWQAYVRDLKAVDLAVSDPAWPAIPV